jgi:hemerythrin HHE cation binding domain-containing protein
MTATAVLPRPRPSSESSSGQWTAGVPAGPSRGPVAAPPSRAVASQRVLHQLARRELRLLAEVAAWTAADDARHATALARHAELVGRVLMHHHAVERDRLWPALRRSVPADVGADVHTELDAALASWTTDCSRIDAQLRDLATAARQWAVATTRPARDAFARACADLARAVAAQTAEEERVLLPLLERHLDPADWTTIARSACAGLSPRERTMLVGLALEDACAADRARLLSGLPLRTRAGWRLVGQSRFRAAVVRLRGEPPAA